jgi:hypothetical protein
MAARRMKASDIGDAQFCAALDLALKLDGGIWVNFTQLEHCLAGRSDLVGPWPDYPYVPADYPEFPRKVVRAKAQRLIDRGLVSGCAAGCTCRGDLELVSQRIGTCGLPC